MPFSESDSELIYQISLDRRSPWTAHDFFVACN